MSEARLESGADGVLRVSGELGFATAARLYAESAAVVGAAPAERPLVFDLEGVSRVDSAGVALLLTWLRGARERGLALELRNVPEQLRSIARVSDLDELLPLDPQAARPVETGQDAG